MSAAVEQGRLTASRDAPVGGQAVLEGVMMRGVTTWAVAVRRPPAEEQRPRRHRRGDVPDPVVEPAPADLPLAGDPRRRRARRVARDRDPRARHLGQRAAPRGGAADLRGGMDRNGRGGRRVRDRPVLRGAGRGDQPDQGSARLLRGVLGGRGRAQDRDLPRVPAPALAREGPQARVRVPRRRAQGDLLLRGVGRAHPRAREAVFALPPPVRHELPAGRDDHGDLRVRSRRAARRGGSS